MKTDTLGVLMAARYPMRSAITRRSSVKASRWARRASPSPARRMADGWMVATTSSARSDSIGRPR